MRTCERLFGSVEAEEMHRLTEALLGCEHPCDQGQPCPLACDQGD